VRLGAEEKQEHDDGQEHDNEGEKRHLTFEVSPWGRKGRSMMPPTTRAQNKRKTIAIAYSTFGFIGLY
jgi:hypothetical protein